MSYLDRNYILGSEYVTEIFFWVKEQEKRPGRAYKKISPQLSKRGQLVEWARDVSCKLGLCESTFHLAVRLIDLFMDGHEIAVSSGDVTTNFRIYCDRLFISGSSTLLGGTWRIVAGSKNGRKRRQHPEMHQAQQFCEELFPHTRLLLYRARDA